MPVHLHYRVPGEYVYKMVTGIHELLPEKAPLGLSSSE